MPSPKDTVQDKGPASTTTAAPTIDLNATSQPAQNTTDAESSGTSLRKPDYTAIISAVIVILGIAAAWYLWKKK